MMHTHARGNNNSYQTTVIWQTAGSRFINFDNLVDCDYVDSSIICSTTEKYRVIIINKQFVNTYFIPQSLSSYNSDSKYNYSCNDLTIGTSSSYIFECTDYDSCLSYSETMNYNYDTSYISIIYSNLSYISFAAITMTLKCDGCRSCFFSNVVIEHDYDDYNYDNYSNYGIRCGTDSCTSIPNSIANKNNNSNMYFSGNFAVGGISNKIIIESDCNYCYSNINSNGCIESNINSDVFCDGYSAYQYAITNRATTVYCDASNACKYSAINNVQTIWINGNSAET